MSVRNAWYVAAWSDDVDSRGPLALYRSADGTAAAVRVDAGIDLAGHRKTRLVGHVPRTCLLFSEARQLEAHSKRAPP